MLLDMLPEPLRPVARFHYRRLRSALDPELEMVCRRLRPGVTAVDVGANDGIYTHGFARAGARVEAFEPQPSCLEVLRAYERLRPAVRVHGIALGARDGEATLVVPRRNGRPITGHARLGGTGSGGGEHQVRVRTLDSFQLRDVAVIKIDVEGHEGEVLLGARETIRQSRPTLLVEIEQRHLARPVTEAFEQVLALGYDGSFLDRGILRPLAEFDVARHQRVENADVGGYYINNFIFTSRP